MMLKITSSSGLKRVLAAAFILLLVFALEACARPATSATTAPHTAASTLPAATRPATTDHEKVVVRPSTRLHAHETVTVTGTGFSAHEALIVIECASKGDTTSASDCNLDGLKSVKASSAGKVVTHFAVTKGPFGTDHIVCKKAKSCLVAVTQESASPSEEATATISFS